eukprot:c1906_g1_i1 orf=94-303(+)
MATLNLFCPPSLSSFHMPCDYGFICWKALVFYLHEELTSKKASVNDVLWQCKGKGRSLIARINSNMIVK